ncbi:T9SS type A sorting domain-containing protein [Christiangramia sp.]|uniref:T9SS type A sorting domain-containing protein n=1 Tax=Christiangramia sp. TaxID=1931228 RepID=UPI0026267FA6|nr:T9SS type A sorting domain-containing protein [Christiangramia sp.]
MLTGLNKNLLFTIFSILGVVYNLTAQEDITISTTYTIAEGETEEYANVILNDNASHLIVNGTLIVHGDLLMSGNKSQFTMGSSAVVIIYGNFIGSNKVDISVSSYLIIQGDFTQPTESTQTNIDIENGNVYIFGEVDGWEADFSSCEDYKGDTTGVNDTECEYGTEENYDNNFESFPPEITEKLSCFSLKDPEDQTSCPGADAIFNTETTTTKAITYQWQVKTPNSDFFADLIGSNSKELNLNNVTDEMSGNLYRVKVRASEEGAGCKVAISKPAALLVETVFDWTGAIGSNWNDPGNWLCSVIPNTSSNVKIPSGLTNYPLISSGAAAMANNLDIQSGTILKISGNRLQVYGAISGQGKIDATAGTLALKGTVNQILDSGLFVNGGVLNLEIDNAAGVTSNTSINLRGWLKLSNGNFSNNNNFTLISDASQTALIDGSGTGEIIGRVRMQRYIDPAFGYKYIGSPFSNTTVGDFSSYIDLNSTFPAVYNYNESRQDSDGNDLSGWEAYTAATAPMNVMEGYAFNFGDIGGAVTIDIEGNINNGDVSRSLNTTHGTFTKGFHLVSNPYPSPIDWNKVPGLSTNIDGAAYFFKADASDIYGGAYTSYVADITSSGSSGSIISSMQGFFVHASDGTTNSVLRMNNSVRVNDFSQEFYKEQEEPLNRPLVRISAGFQDEKISDPLVIYLDRAASWKFERNKDALKLYNSNIDLPNFYSITADGKESSINGLSEQETTNNFRLPLGIKTKRSGQLIIKPEDIENFDTDLFLIDKHRRVSVNLKEENYSLNLEKGKHEDRFYLSFSSAKFVDSPTLFNDPFSIKNNTGEVIVRMNLKEEESGILRISTIHGQLLQLRKVRRNEEVNFTEIRSTGIYLVTFISDKRQFSKKIIVRK